MKCIDCYWFSRCEQLIQRTGDEEACDWDPTRFMQKRSGDEEEDEMIAVVDHMIKVDKGLKGMREITDRMLKSLTPKELKVLRMRYKIPPEED